MGRNAVIADLHRHEVQRHGSGMAASPRTSTSRSGPGARTPRSIDPPVFIDRSRGFLRGAIAIFALLLLSLFLVKPAWRWIQQSSGLGRIDQIEAFVRRQRPPGEVEPILRQALSAAPNHPRVLRAAAQFAAANGRDEGYAWWTQLLASPEATPEDHLQFVEHALNGGRPDLSGPELARLLRLDPSNVRTLRLMIRNHEMNDDPLAAVAVARQWLAEHPELPEPRFILGKLLLKHSAPPVRREGHHLLASLASGDSVFASDAISLLVAQKDLTAGQRNLLIQALEDRTQLGDRLQWLALRCQSEPERRREILDTAIAKLPLLSGTNLVTTVDWLSTMGEYDRILAILPFSQARLDPALLSRHLAALAALNRFSELEPHLRDSTLPLDPSQNHLLLAAIALHQGRQNTAEDAFNLAIRAAGPDPNKLRVISEQAERLGLTSAAIAATEARGQLLGQATSAAQEMIRLGSGLPDAQTALQLIRRVRAKMNSSATLAAEEIYLRILLNEDLPSAHAQVTTLAATHPGSRDLRLIQALAELQRKNPMAARSLVESEAISPFTAPLRWRVINTAVLGGSGDGDTAREWAKRLDLSKLKPQEKDLVRPWLPSGR